MGDEVVTEIRLIGYPVRLGGRQQEHLDEVTREFMLLSTSRPELRERVPDHLLDLLERLTAHPSSQDALRRVQEQPGSADTVDLVYAASDGARAAVTSWQSMLEQVDEYCRHDELLALATPADVVALRDWIVSEFLAQLDGHPPTPWPGAPAG